MALRPNILTISPGAAFLPTLADALLDGALVPGFGPRGNPLALAGATLVLPTRRAARQLRETFLDRLGTQAALLPRLVALGEVDEEGALLEGAASDLVLSDGAGALDLPEAATRLQRQLALTRLILAWGQATRHAVLAPPGEPEPLLIPASAGDAAGLAADLARFLDSLELEGVPFERLAGLAQEQAGRHDRYWDFTLRFLAIATAEWPAILADLGRLDPVDRANRLLAAEAGRLVKEPGPVIIAGVIGAIPAEHRLVRAALHHPRGAVVLPGLDLGLEEAAWTAVSGSPGHAQAGLKALLDELGLSRDDVRLLGPVPADRADRTRLVGDALRPAAATAFALPAERRLPHDRAAAALAGLTLVEAANEGEEALAIALVLREALEQPGRCAALVTPDRALAARVIAELDRWGLAADDSAGRPLLSTPPGIFVRLVLDAALADFAPVPVLALLKHPFARLGRERATVRAATEALELAALRGPQPPPGILGLRTALAAGQESLDHRHAPRWRRQLKPGDWAVAEDLLQGLDQGLGALADLLCSRDPAPASAFFDAHARAVRALAAEPDGEAHELFRLEAGHALAELLDELARVEPGELVVSPGEYPGLFAALAAGRAVRGGEPSHPRIAIYGLLEARLLTIDRLVLGGFDEGLWPPEVRTDAWLNRPMRESIGLSAPERRIGLAAHDFEQALGAREVVLTRAHKRGGAPTVPARWLQRLSADLGETFRLVAARGKSWHELAAALDRPVGRVPLPQAPRPRPPLALRPQALSVTEIEHLVRDPYTIYARHVLRLHPIDAVGGAPGAADRGTLVHEAVQRFATLCEAGVPADAEQRLLAIGDELLAALADYPDVQAFWRPRFARIAATLARWEAARRPSLAGVAVERAGALVWQTGQGREFTLRARADRIETGRDGVQRIVDFKTGQAPTAKQVQTGLSPQLALEAAILLGGGFSDGLDPQNPVELMVVPLTGRAGPEPRDLVFEAMTAAEVGAHALVRLKGLIERFEDEDTPYASLLHPMFKGRRYGDYDHLARVGEWSLAGDEEA